MFFFDVLNILSNSVLSITSVNSEDVHDTESFIWIHSIPIDAIISACIVYP